MGGPSAQGDGPAVVSAMAVHWKSNTPPWVRAMFISNLMENLKKREPTSVPEVLNKLKMLAGRVEEKAFMLATSPQDYVWKIKLAKRNMETMPIPNSGVVGRTSSNSVNMASQQVGSQPKNNPRKQLIWTENMDQVLVNGLLEVGLSGPKRTENGFKYEVTKVIDKLRETCHVSVCLADVRARLCTLYKIGDDIKKLVKTGVLILDSCRRVLAGPISGKTYIKEKPDRAKMKEKPDGNDAVTGDRAVSENDFSPMSKPVDDLEGKNDVEETKSSHSTNSYRSVQGHESPPRRKRRKLVEDDAVAFDKQASQNYVNGQALLEKLKEMDINQGDILDLMEVFEKDEKAGKFFLEITDVEYLRLWVYRKLGRDTPR